ncbi:MAG: agmatinase family protein [Labilithrix sp.]|nr:agmatinase family protein [Labilithrix sp.]MCW5812794.1 agmatinase family protein [Labilithrix sp.]
MSFDPNAPARPGAGIFGLPHTEEQALVVLVPVPWEATTSYGGGAAEGPRVILEASAQVDLFDLDVDRPYEHGIFMRPLPAEVVSWNEEGKAAAARVIEAGGDVAGDAELQSALALVNGLSKKVNAHVEAEVADLLAKGKIVGVVGGDHSVPWGALRALAKREKDFGVLHFDAHSDTREAYEGFTHSHASIMFNVLEDVPEVKKLVQVGIRDVCEAEVTYCEAQGDRVQVFYDRDLARRKMEGEPFGPIAREIAAALPNHVWISFDIDGLDPRYCPHTGTPVPGGLELAEAIAVIREVVRADKRIVGFDLNEVAPNLADADDEWDGNVGARLLYKLIAFTLASHGKAKLRS